MSKRIRPISALFKKGVKCLFTTSVEVIVRDILAELAAPPFLVFSDWDAVEDGSRPFRVYCGASIDCFGATLEQEQPDGSVRPIAYVSRATLDSGRHCKPARFGSRQHRTGNQAPLRLPLRYEVLHFLGPHKALENVGKVGDHNAQVQRWFVYLTAFDYTLEYLRGSANGNAETFSRGCHSRRLSTTAAVLAASPLSTMRPYTSLGLAACLPPPHRSPALAWVGWCPNPIAPSWVGLPLLPPLIFAILAHTGHV